MRINTATKVLSLLAWKSEYNASPHSADQCVKSLVTLFSQRSMINDSYIHGLCFILARSYETAIAL